MMETSPQRPTEDQRSPISKARLIGILTVSVGVVLLSLVGLPLRKDDGLVSYASPPLSLSTPQQTNFQIQNKENVTTTVKIDFYDTNGNIVATEADTIGPQASRIYYQMGDTNLPDGFRGSAVVSADKQIEVIVGEVRYPGSPFMTAAHSGVTQGATSVVVPVVWKAYSSGWNTRLTVQNTDSSNPTDVSITYYNLAGSPVTTTTVSIPGNASRLYDHGDMSQLGTKFEGYATISSSRPVATVIDEYQNQYGKLLSYNAVAESDAATTLYAPLVAKKYSAGWYSNMYISNRGDSPAQVTIRYKGYICNKTTPVTPYELTTTKTVNSALPVYQAQEALPDNFRGTAVLESTQPIVARVHWALSEGYAAGGYNTATSGSNTVYLPTLYKNYSAGWYTGIHIMTTTDTPGTVQIKYTGKLRDGTYVAPVTKNYDIAKSLSVYQYSEPLPDDWFGGAVVTASQPIVVEVEENPLPGVYNGDALIMYSGFPG